MTDLMQLTDAELDKAAAEAIGWHEVGPDERSGVGWIDPLGEWHIDPPRPVLDMNHAIEFAEQWRKKGVSRSHILKSPVGPPPHTLCTYARAVVTRRRDNGISAWTERCGDSPHDPDHTHDAARALCRAVLAAIEAEAGDG